MRNGIFSPTGGRLAVLYYLSLVFCNSLFTVKVCAFVCAPFFSRQVLKTEALGAAPQVLEFREPKTNVTVMLVGAMHYNPASIALAEDTCRKLGETASLGSVVVESCSIRWEAAKKMNEDMPLMRKLLGNEMRAACDISEEYGRPVVLGDQLINVTVARLKETFSETAIDLVSPLGGGWGRFRDDVGRAFGEAMPKGDGYIGASGILDLKLIAGLPVSFLKYPASYLTRSPLGTLVFGSVLYLLNSIDNANAAINVAADMSSPEYILSSIFSLGFAVLETAFFARLLLVVLLAERNVTLAQSILEQCEIYSGEPSSQDESNAINDFISNIVAPVRNLFGVNPSLTVAKNYVMRNEEGEKVVVAILGMAHCNGIKKLLMEERSGREY